MVTVTAPRSLLGRFARDGSAIRARLRGRPAGLSRHVLTFAALTCADVAAWMHGPTVGLAVTAASLLVADYKIQDG